MHLIAYLSHYTGAASDIQADLAQIEAAAKIRNLDMGITGVLFYFDGRFFQVIEGDETALRQLYAHIARDPRHSSIECLIDQPVEEPSFTSWNMDTFNLSQMQSTGVDVIKGVVDAYKANFKIKADRLVAVIKGFLLKQKPAA